MNYIIKILLFLACASAALAQTTPIRNPQVQGTSGSIISGATLTNNGTFINSGTMNGAGTFNFGSGTVTLPATVGGLGSWTGSGSITTLGTITTGIWNGTTLAAGYGGTGQTSIAASVQALLDSISTTQGTIIYNNGTDWVALAPGTSGYFLKTQGAAANPVWAAASGGGGSGTPGGSNTQIQYNNASTFGGISGATSNGTIVTLTDPAVLNSITTSSTTFTALAGATTLLTLGGTGGNATVTIPGTEAATGIAGVGALNVAGGANFVKNIYANGLRVGRTASSNKSTFVGSGLSVESGAGANTAIGDDAVFSTTTGAGNTGVGQAALYANAIGDSNTAIGLNALASTTASSSATAVGATAGSYLSDNITTVTSAASSVFVGADTHPLTATDSNTIIIGADAVGAGSNTTEIGTSSTTQSHLFGTLLTDASTTTRAGFSLPHGNAPTSPVNGNVWTTTAGMYAQINGATVGPFSAGGGGLTIGTTTITSGTSGRVLYDNAGVVGELALGTGVSTTLATNLSITGGGTIGLGGFTLTVPATGTAALLGTANTFTGVNTFPVGSAAAPTVAFTGVTRGFFSPGNSAIDIAFASSSKHTFWSDGSYYQNDTTAELKIAARATLVGDASNILALKSGASAQEFRIYGTTTGSKYLSLKHDGTNGLISASSGVVKVTTGGLTVGTNGTNTTLVKHGTATLVAGTVTVSDSDVVAGSRIFINRQTDGGTLGDSYSVAITAATNFVIQSKTANANVAGDTSTVSWIMVNP